MEPKKQTVLLQVPTVQVCERRFFYHLTCLCKKVQNIFKNILNDMKELSDNFGLTIRKIKTKIIKW